MLTQVNIARNVESVQYEKEPGCVMLSVLPVHHAFCLVMDWMKGFSLGAVVCINDSFMHMVRNMGIFKPEVMLMVPLMIEMIYKRLSAADPAILKKVLAEKVFGGNLKTDVAMYTVNGPDVNSCNTIDKTEVQIREGSVRQSLDRKTVTATLEPHSVNVITLQ